MNRQQLADQLHLLTLRQIVAAIAIVACLAFVVSYSTRILASIKVQNELSAWKASVAEEQAAQQRIQAELAAIKDPSAVEAYARGEQNMVRPGDQPLIAIEAGAAKAVQQTAPEAQTQLSAPPHWGEWLDILNKGALPTPTQSTQILP